MRFELLPVVAVAMAGMIGTPARADDAVYVITYIDVMPAARAQAAELIHAYRAARDTEPGRRSVEALQETTRPGRFVVVEAWDSQGTLRRTRQAPRRAAFTTALRRSRIAPPTRECIAASACRW